MIAKAFALFERKLIKIWSMIAGLKASRKQVGKSSKFHA